ncbi:NAD(P) transhydrogenase, alpha subunit [gamma proteobacterium HTCC5015]|nr:NAD(P) transhydrogenase, alpha subunit [gamma proteobacterium HTCC5015]
MPIKIGVPKEVLEGEQRVALDPGVVTRLVKQAGAEVLIEKDAGKSAHFLNEAYEDAKLVDSADEVYQNADVVLKVQAPTDEELNKMREGQLVISFMDPYRKHDTVKALAEKKINSIAMELIPRISRAQAMDALSSQAGLAGYKCAIQAAELSPGFFPMLTTAAGTIRPAKVLVVGAGVAGLQAIATAKRLGAQVEAYDIRPDAKEQVESLGAKLIDTGVDAAGEGGYARELTDEEKAQQAEALAAKLKEVNAVITTAAIPGRPAPKIISGDMVADMKAGAVIVDMAAETGGNCELTQAGETIVTDNGVTIAGPVNIPSKSPVHASEMYAKNLLNLVNLMIEEGELKPDWEDEVLAGGCLTRDGEIKHEGVKSVIGG